MKLNFKYLAIPLSIMGFISNNYISAMEDNNDIDYSNDYWQDDMTDYCITDDYDLKTRIKNAIDYYTDEISSNMDNNEICQISLKINELEEMLKNTKNITNEQKKYLDELESKINKKKSKLKVLANENSKYENESNKYIQELKERIKNIADYLENSFNENKAMEIVTQIIEIREYLNNNGIITKEQMKYLDKIENEIKEEQSKYKYSEPDVQNKIKDKYNTKIENPIVLFSNYMKNNTNSTILSQKNYIISLFCEFISSASKEQYFKYYNTREYKDILHKISYDLAFEELDLLINKVKTLNNIGINNNNKVQNCIKNLDDIKNEVPLLCFKFSDKDIINCILDITKHKYSYINFLEGVKNSYNNGKGFITNKEYQNVLEWFLYCNIYVVLENYFSNYNNKNKINNLSIDNLYQKPIFINNYEDKLRIEDCSADPVEIIKRLADFFIEQNKQKLSDDEVNKITNKINNIILNTIDLAMYNVIYNNIKANKEFCSMNVTFLQPILHTIFNKYKVIYNKENIGKETNTNIFKKVKSAREINNNIINIEGGNINNINVINEEEEEINTSHKE